MDTVEVKVNPIKKLFLRHKNTLEFLKENKLDFKTMIISFSISLGIALFFTIPGIFIIINIALFNSFITMIISAITILLFLFIYLSVYFDVCKHYSEKYKEEDFKPYIIVSVFYFLIILTISFIVAGVFL